MMFGTTTGSDKQTHMTFLGKTFSDIRENGFSDASSINKIQIKELKEYANAVSAMGKEAFPQLEETMSHCTKEQRDFATQCGTNSASIRQLASDTEQVGIKAKASSFGVKALAFAFNAIASVGIVILLSTITKGIFDVVNGSQKLAEEANELGNSIKQTNEDIDSYKEKVDELNNTISDSDSSYEEVTQARKDLLNVQNEMIEKYGSESDSINMITEAIQNQSDAWEQLKIKQAQALIDKNDTKDTWNWEHPFQSTGRKLNELGFAFTHQNEKNSANDEYFTSTGAVKINSVSERARLVGNNSVIKLQKSSNERINNLMKSLGFNDNYELVGDLQETHDALVKIKEASDGASFDEKDTFLKKLDNQTNKNTEDYESYIDLVNAQNTVQATSNKEYAKYSNNLDSIYKNYQDAVIKDDTQAIAKYAKEYANSFNDAVTLATKNGNSNIVSYFDNLHSDMQQTIGDINFNTSFEKTVKKNTEDTLKDSRAKIKNSAMKQVIDSGNVDLYDRPVIYWNDKNIAKNASALQSNGIDYKSLKNEYSTLLSMNKQITNGNLKNNNIVYTPVLSDGTVLDSDTLNSYIKTITEQATDKTDLLSLDKKGMYVGNTFVSGIVEGVQTASPEMVKKFSDNFDTMVNNLPVDATSQELSDKTTTMVMDAIGASKDVLGNEYDGFREEIQDIVLDGLNNNDSIDEIITNIKNNMQYILSESMGSLKAETLHIQGASINVEIDKALNSQENEVQKIVDKQPQLTSDDYNRMNDLYSQNEESFNKSAEYTEEEKNNFKELLQYADAQHTSITNIVSELRKYKLIQSDILKDAKAKFEKPVNLIASGTSSKEAKEERVKEDWIEGLSDEDLTALMKLDVDGDATEATLKMALRDAQNFLNDNPVTIETDTNSQNVNDNIAKLQEAYNAVYTKDSDGKIAGQKAVDYSMLNSLTSSFGDTKGYQDLENALTNINGLASDTKERFNEVAASYLKSSGFLDNLTNSNKDASIAMLKSWGYTNAQAIVENKLAINTDKVAAKTQAMALEHQFAAKTGKDVADVSYQEISAFLTQAGATQAAKDALFELVAQEQVFNNNGLDVQGKLTSLAQLATAYGNTALSAMAASAAMDTNNMPTAGAGNIDSGETRLNNLQKNLDKYVNEYQKAINDIKIDWTPLTTGASDAASGAKDAAEETKDVLAELSSQLDEIQSAYQSLMEIQDAYNKSGKITVDQAQTLINTDFRYLAELNTQNGALSVNQGAFQSLAKAKLNEMQIQLARNAIDAISNLKTEADAAIYLANAYKDLGNATLSATQASLQAAVLSAQAKGVMQGQAANMIYQGYLNASAMLSKVDFSPSGMGYNPQTDSSDNGSNNSNDDNNDTEEDKTTTDKKTYDWIEVLFDRLNVITNKWKDQIDRFSSWWNKNYAINKTIKANSAEITAKQNAYNYYMSRANSLGLSSYYTNKIQNGEYNVEEVSVTHDSDDESDTLLDIIDKYKEWYEKALDCKEALQDLYDTERDLIQQKLDSIIDYFGTIQDYYDSVTSKYEALISVKNTKGQNTSLTDLLQEYSSNQDNYNNALRQQYAYQTGVQPDASKSIESIQKELATTITTNKDKLEAEIKASYEKQISSINASDTESLEAVRKEEEDALIEFERKYNQQVNENTTSIAKQEESLWEVVKNVADYQVESLEKTIDALDGVIEKYKSIAELLENNNKNVLNQYGISKLLGLDNDDSLTQLIEKEINSAIDSSKTQINTLVEQAQLYQDLINASNTNNFSGVFDKYKSSASTEVQALIDSVTKQLNSNNYSDSTWVTAWQSSLNDIISKITDSISDVQKLKDELRENVYFKAITNSITQLENLNDKLSAMANVVSDDWVTDINGVTEFGLAKVQILGNELKNAQEIVNDYAEKIQKVQDAKDTYATEEDYASALQSAYKDYYNSLSSAEDIAQSIYEIGKKQAQSELDALTKVTDARKKALSAKKSYYEYDKTIQQQTKDVETLKAQVEALSNVSTAEAKAKQAELQSQLKDAQDTLNDTVTEHTFDLETDALDDLVTKMTDALDTSTKTISETFEDFAKTLTQILGDSSKVSVDDVYSKIINLLLNNNGTAVTNTTGTSSTSSTGVSTTSTNNVSQLVASGNIVSINQDTVNLFSNAIQQIYALQQTQSNASANYYAFVQSNLGSINSLLSEASKVKVPVTSVTGNGAVVVNNSYDSLLHVDGSVDATVLKDVQSLLKDSYEYTSKQMYADLKKMGVIRSY